MEKTLIVLKPDAVGRRLIGRVVARFEEKGLKIVGMKMLSVSEPLAREMYNVHEGEDFYEPLVEFITASPVVAMVIEGNEVIKVSRGMLGKTFGPDAQGGTIRGDFGMSRRYNLIHGSDSTESAQREIPLFFSPEELVEYELPGDRWTYAEFNGELI